MIDELLHRALELIETGNLEAASEIVEAVIGEEPKNARAWRLRGQIATEPGEKIAYLKKALELAPHHLETREQLEALGVTLPPLTLRPDDTAPIRMGKPDVNIEQTQVSSRTQVMKTRDQFEDEEPEIPAEATAPAMATRRLIREPEVPADATTRAAVVKEPANRRGCVWVIVLLFVIVIGGGITLMAVVPDQPQVASLRALFQPSATPVITPTPLPPTENGLPTPTSVPTLTATLIPTEAIPSGTVDPTITLTPPDHLTVPENVDGLHLFSGKTDVQALEDNGNFGWSVDVDGDTLVVGVPGEANTTGKVYIYAREGDHWWPQQQLSSDMVEGTNDLFGWSVSLDGDMLAVGAPGDNALVGDAGQPGDQLRGATYVFARKNGEWKKMFILLPEIPGLMFGNAVDLDGNTLAVGAPTIDPAAGENGLVFIYQPGDSRTWEKPQILGEGEDVGLFFGHRLALDGNRLVIGNQPANTDDDTVYVYEFSRNSWKEAFQLTKEQITPEDRFGFAVAVNGSRIAVSNLPTVLPSNNNVITIYEEDSGMWESTVTLQNPVEGLSFGHSIDLEGDILVVGAPWEGLPGAHQAGQVFVFTYDGNNWIESHRLFMPTSGIEDIPPSMVGWSVAIDGDQVAAGAPDQSPPPDIVGGALLFTLEPYR